MIWLLIYVFNFKIDINSYLRFKNFDFDILSFFAFYLIIIYLILKLSFKCEKLKNVEYIKPWR